MTGTAGALFVRQFRLASAAQLEALANVYDGLAMNGSPRAQSLARRIDPDQPWSVLDAMRANAARQRLEAVRHPL